MLLYRLTFQQEKPTLLWFIQTEQKFKKNIKIIPYGKIIGKRTLLLLSAFSNFQDGIKDSESTVCQVGHTAVFKRARKAEVIYGTHGPRI